MYVKVDKLQPGLKLGRSLLDIRLNVPLIKKGVVLTENYIELLKKRMSKELYVFVDYGLTEKPIQEVVPVSTRVEVTSKIDIVLKSKGKVEIKNIEKQSNEIAKIVSSHVRDSTIDSFWRIFEQTTVSAHLLNVAILSVAIGTELKYTIDECNALCACALLHDIGIKHPKIINYIDYKNPYYWLHTTKGYSLIFDEPLIATIAIQHHERQNGIGYPCGISKIHEFSIIVGMADIYDSLMSGHAGFPKLDPVAAYKMTKLLAEKYYDDSFVSAFSKSIELYPAGTPVMLNTGRVGVVLGTEKGNPLVQKVRILCDAENKPVKPVEKYTDDDEYILRILSVEEVLELQKIIDHQG